MQTIYIFYYFRFLSGKSTLFDISTLGVPNYFNTYKLSDGEIVHVHVMDTAGEEAFRSITTGYYRRADCCLLVYDITKNSSFEEIKNYYNEQLKEKCKKEASVVLLGNKTDLEDQRQVPSEEGAALALENDYIFVEASCLKNTNVANAFETLIEITNINVKKNQKNEVKIEKNITIKKNEKRKGKFYC